MFKIWARIIREEKIIKQVMYENNENFNIKNFFDYLIDICKELDIETPILLKKHTHNFTNFNSVKFFGDDFLDTVSFDYFILENVKE